MDEAAAPGLLEATHRHSWAPRGGAGRGLQASSVLGPGVALCIPAVLARTLWNGLRPRPAASGARL